MSLAESVRSWARRIKRDALMLWFARRHADTPLPVKLLCAFTVAYALSPIDLIPDFIPVLGYLDDALLLPALIWLAVRLLPAHVTAECRLQAEAWLLEKGKPVSRTGATIIVVLWLAFAWLCWRWYDARG